MELSQWKFIFGKCLYEAESKRARKFFKTRGTLYMTTITGYVQSVNTPRYN